jgi:hypothetical protein
MTDDGRGDGRRGRRRLTLAPLKQLPPPSPSSGSRFACLIGEVSDDDAEGLAEAVAWQGIVEDPLVPPITRNPELSPKEIVMDFWSKIGYPTPESRSWERASSASSLKVHVLRCRDVERARSSSPVRSSEAGTDRRAASSSPVPPGHSATGTRRLPGYRSS